jgi:hypothetical protein
MASHLSFIGVLLIADYTPGLANEMSIFGHWVRRKAERAGYPESEDSKQDLLSRSKQCGMMREVLDGIPIRLLRGIKIAA